MRIRAVYTLNVHMHLSPYLCVLSVFQDKCVCSKRQLWSSSERPPGVFAPVEEQWEETLKDSSCPHSVNTVSHQYVASLIVLYMDQGTSQYVHIVYNS